MSDKHPESDSEVVEFMSNKPELEVIEPESDSEAKKLHKIISKGSDLFPKLTQESRNIALRKHIEELENRIEKLEKKHGDKEE